MHLKRSFAVIGGDLRQRCLLRQLRGLGFPASAYRVPDAEDSAPDLSGCLRGANVLILPMPAGGGVPLADILDAAEPGALICGGMLDPAEALLQARGIAFYDYAKDEALLLQNAELTAEAALALLLERLPGPLAGSRILLCGFGRIGKLLARKLKALGADVTVSARKAQALDLARILGYRRVRPEAGQTRPRSTTGSSTPFPHRSSARRSCHASAGTACCWSLPACPAGSAPRRRRFRGIAPRVVFRANTRRRLPPPSSEAPYSVT